MHTCITGHSFQYTMHTNTSEQLCMLTSFLQINKMVKHMNKGKPSENRIVTTTCALNHSMPLQRSIKVLRLTKEQKERKYVSGTKEDVQKLRSHISKVLGSTGGIGNNKVVFTKATWSGASSSTFIMLEPVSDRVEEAFGNVCDWVLKNTKMLVNSDNTQWEEVQVNDIDDNEDAQQAQAQAAFRSTQ